MKAIEKVIDINAHIENLKCDVYNNNGSTIANISFDNLGDGDITAIKFNACGYNSFGDVVPINGKEKFLLIIQDITIKKNERAKDLKAKLPSEDIKKMELEECQICFADGTVASYNGKNSFTISLEEIDNQEELSALHKLYSDKAKYRIKDFAQGWICSCGRFNIRDLTKCSLCSKEKSESEQVCSTEGLRKLVVKYQISEEEDKKTREEVQKKAVAEKKKRNFIIGIVVAVCIALAFPIGHSIQLSQRTIYSSVDEMKEAIKGTYTYYEDYDAKYMIKIEENTITKRWVNLGSESDMDLTIESWNPKEGTIEVSLGNYVVTRDGDIKDEDGNKFELGGSWSDSDSGSSSYGGGSYESGYTELDINSLSWDSNSSYKVCTGKVTNNGDKTYYFVTVKGAFKDSSGNVLDTDSTYAVGSEGLAPGESSSFRLSVDKDSKITDCSVSILDFD